MSEQPQEPPKYLLTVEEAARSLSISRVGMYRLFKRGELPSVKIGHARRVSRRALEAYIARLEGVEGQAEA